MSAVVLSTAARDASASAGMAALLAHIDGAGAARLLVYGGTMPPAGGAATGLVAGIVLAHPVGTLDGGRLDFNVVGVFGQRITAATATWVRLVRGDGEYVLDGAVGDVFVLDKVDGQVGALIELTGGALVW